MVRVEVTTCDGRVEREVADSLAIGRMPGRTGVVIGVDDDSVSRVALCVAHDGKHTSVENRSRYAKLSIQSEFAVRSLLPGERLWLAHDTLVVVPGEGTTYRIKIVGIRPLARPRRVGGSMTRRYLASSPRPRVEQRHLALVALCLPRFDPQGFPGGLLKAPQIAEQLQRAGTTVTAKAVNNKLLRLRQQFGAAHGVYLGSREELADFAIEHDLVTMNHVKALRTLQQGRLRRTGEVSNLAHSPTAAQLVL